MVLFFHKGCFFKGFSVRLLKSFWAFVCIFCNGFLCFCVASFFCVCLFLQCFFLQVFFLQWVLCCFCKEFCVFLQVFFAVVLCFFATGFLFVLAFG